MKTKIQACIFDLDGTLTDTLEAISYFGNLALQEFGFQPVEKERYRYLVGDGRDELIHRMLEEQGQGADTEENFIKVGGRYDQAYQNDFTYRTDAYEGIKQVLKALRQQGVQTAVLSNKPHNVVCAIIDKVFEDGTFDAVYGKQDGMAAKPEPDSANRLARELGVQNSRCAFIGDTNVDIRTGKNAGMMTIGVLWGFRDRKELEDAGADAVVTHPKQILNAIKDENRNGENK